MALKSSVRMAVSGCCGGQALRQAKENFEFKESKMQTVKARTSFATLALARISWMIVTEGSKREAEVGMRCERCTAGPINGDSKVSSHDNAGLHERVLPSLPLMRGGVGRLDKGTYVLKKYESSSKPSIAKFAEDVFEVQDIADKKLW